MVDLISKVNKIGVFVSRLDNIKQWLELDTFNDESVSQHSFKVAIYSAVLFKEVFNGNYYDEKLSVFYNAVLLHALFHDFDESLILRDLSHEVKYNEYNGEEIRSAVNDFARHSFFTEFFNNQDCEKQQPESDVESMLYEAIFPTSDLVKKFVKFCDWLAMAHYLIRELKLGNTNLNGKVKNVKAGIKIAGATLIQALKQTDFGTFNPEPIKEVVFLVTNIKNN